MLIYFDEINKALNDPKICDRIEDLKDDIIEIKDIFKKAENVQSIFENAIYAWLHFQIDFMSEQLKNKSYGEIETQIVYIKKMLQLLPSAPKSWEDYKEKHWDIEDVFKCYREYREHYRDNMGD